MDTKKKSTDLALHDNASSVDPEFEEQCRFAARFQFGFHKLPPRNRYLAWAYVEAANFAIRFCEPARKFYQRKKAIRNGVVAIKAVAHKLARACFHMLKTGEGFSVERCFT